LIESNKAGHVELSQKGKTVYFSKRVDEAVPHGGVIPSHRDLCDRLDYEVELGVVLGREAKRTSREEALACVFGYTIINDVSARNVQEAHKQWYFGKSLDGFCPMGPCIVTAAEFGDPKGHALCSIINGELRQNSNTELMMQDVPGLIAELSAGITLKAGTVIATGTPAGVAMGMNPPQWLQPGDTVECRIEGIGSLINTIGE
ncbi:MAG: fumarylacetoacetate hydrolase family protein, partial [Clostridia bacterium]|nr:fumarylacetoacetate hydrolase family protein [Clostridia bacterium]